MAPRFKREMIKQVSGKLEDQKRVSWEKLREARHSPFLLPL